MGTIPERTIDDLSAIISDMARLLGQAIETAAKAGIYDGDGQQHVTELLVALDRQLREKHIRGADYHLRAAIDAVHNVPAFPRRRLPSA